MRPRGGDRREHVDDAGHRDPGEGIPPCRQPVAQTHHGARRGHALSAVVERVDGVDRFDRTDVVDWLQRTGRGNNQADQALDAAAFTAPDEARFGDVVTLLALYALSGADFGSMSHSDLVDTARAADPDDELLLREVRRLSVTGMCSATSMI